jgi:hypothetical protein
VADNGTVRIKKPDFQQDAKINLSFGSSIFELDAEMDARDQYPAAKVFAWDSKDLAVREAEASDDGVSGGLIDTGGLGAALSSISNAVSAIGGALGLDLPGAPPNTDFTQVMARSHIVLTDSGGVQEEAPSLGKPVLVMRENTERPEAVSAGTVRLVGTDEDRLVREVSTLVTDRAAYDLMSNAVNPYGDGSAAARVCAAARAFFGDGERMPDFA